MRDSGLDLEKANRDEIGVFLGSGIGGLQTTAEQHKVLLDRGPSCAEQGDELFERRIDLEQLADLVETEP